MTESARDAIHGIDLDASVRTSEARLRIRRGPPLQAQRKPTIELAEAAATLGLASYLDHSRVDVISTGSGQSVPDQINPDMRDVVIVPASWLDPQCQPIAARAAALAVPCRQLIAYGSRDEIEAIRHAARRLVAIPSDLPPEIAAESLVCIAELAAKGDSSGDTRRTTSTDTSAMANALLGRMVNEIANASMSVQPSLRALDEFAQSEPSLCEHVAVIEAVCQRFNRYVGDVNTLLSADTREVTVSTAGVLEQYIETEVANRPPGLRFVSRIATDLWPVNLDATDLKTICRNLVNNSFFAIQRGGTVRLEASNVHVSQPNLAGIPEADYVRIRVIDDGTGMSDETKLHATDAFFTTWARHQHWSGLGLTQVETLCRRCAGELMLRSEVGQGTVATALLRRGVIQASRKRLNSAESRSLSSPHLLLVDDEPLVLAALHRGLVQAGYEVFLAQDSLTALSVLEENPQCRVAVLDVHLGSSSGVTLAREIISRYPEARLVLTTGFLPTDVETNLVADLDPHIPLVRKPFELPALLSALTPCESLTPG